MASDSGPGESVIHNEGNNVNNQAHNMYISCQASSKSTHNKSPKVFPSGRRDGFFGREEDLRQLQAFLADNENEIDQPGRKVIVVQGGIGYGKTQLCLTFAYRNRERFHCWLIPAGSYAEINHGFRSINMDLLARGALQEDREFFRKKEAEDHINDAQRWLATQRHWMLIFDNANPDIDLEADYLPDTPDGVIIINGRRPQLKAKAKGPFKRVHVLHPLSKQVGTDLFKKVLANHEDEPVGPRESKLIEDIVHDLDCIPLAVELAVSMIRARGRQVSLRERLKQYKKYWDSPLTHRFIQEDVGVILQPIQRIFDLLEAPKQSTATSRVHEDAISLLQLLSCLGPQPLSISVLESSWKNWKFTRARHEPECRSYPRILKDYETNTFAAHKIHRAISLLDDLTLIQITLHEENSEITFNTYVKGCILHYMRSRSFDFDTDSRSTITMLVQSVSWEDDLDQWTHPIRLLPHLQAKFESEDEAITTFCAAICESDGPEVGLDIALKIGTVYFQGGQVKVAEIVQEFAFSNARKTFGVYHRITLRAMSEIATTYMILDRPAEALDLREKTFQFRETISQQQISFGFAVSCISQNLFYALRSSRWPTWEAISPSFCGIPFEDALNMLPIAWNSSIIRTNSDIRRRNSLAYQQISMNLADSLAALPSLQNQRKALQMRRNVALQRILTISKTSEALRMDNLQRRIEATRKVAFSLHNLRQYPASFRLRKKIYGLCKTEEYNDLLKHSVLTLRVMGELAESYTKLGNDVAALELSENIPHILVNQLSFPENHVQVILAERGLAHSHKAIYNLRLAQNLYESVEANFLMLFGPHHRLSINAAEDVALAMDRRRNVGDALTKQRAVIIEKNKLYGSEGEETLNSLELVVNMLLNDQILAYLASKLQYYVINARNRQHHINDVALYNSINNLANCFVNSDEGHYLEIEEDGCKLCDKAQNIRSKVLSSQVSHPNLGDHHLDTLMTMSGLADDYDMQWRFHMGRGKSIQLSHLESRHAKVSVSISERDPTDSETRDSVFSSDEQLQEELHQEWDRFLVDDCIDESVYRLLATNTAVNPIILAHDGSHISSPEVLQSRSLELREYVLQKSIAVCKVAATKGRNTEAWRAENRLVRRAEEKLAESKSLYGLDPAGPRWHQNKKVTKWLEDNEPETEAFEAEMLVVWPPSPESSCIESEVEE